MRKLEWGVVHRIGSQVVAPSKSRLAHSTETRTSKRHVADQANIVSFIRVPVS